MAKLLTSVFVIGCFVLVVTERGLAKHVRLLLENPSDTSSYLGYKDHSIHDMSSLVNEAKAQAHGQNGPAAQRQSLSFAGTNLWRCDAHVVEVCDINCLDVDPKDGCPFCLQTCQSKLHGQWAQSSSTGSQSGAISGSSAGSSSSSGGGAQSGTSQSGSSFPQPSSGTGGQTSQSGSPFQQPSSATGAGTVSQTGSGQSSTGSQLVSGLSGTGNQTGTSGTISQQHSGLTGTGSGSSQAGQQPSGLTGTGSQSGSSLSGTAGQQPSGLAGTSNQLGGQGIAGSKTGCPYYPPNCPAAYTKLQNGCLICTILKQAALVVTNAPTSSSTSHPTCPPRRCVAPCNVGIVMGTDGCPHCKCPDHI